MPARNDNGVSPDSRFTKIVCCRNYAVARAPERTDSDEQYVVFKFASASWTVHSSGSGDICPGVPADVVKHPQRPLRRLQLTSRPGARRDLAPGRIACTRPVRVLKN